MMGLKIVTANRPTFCSQTLSSLRGHFLPSDRGLFPRFTMIPRRCSHSPGAGMGHTVHHRRPVRGTSTIFRTAHHTIHTKTKEKFLLPTGVPKRPVMMASTKPNRVSSISTG